MKDMFKRIAAFVLSLVMTTGNVYASENFNQGHDHDDVSVVDVDKELDKNVFETEFLDNDYNEDNYGQNQEFEYHSNIIQGTSSTTGIDGLFEKTNESIKRTSYEDVNELRDYNFIISNDYLEFLAKLEIGNETYDISIEGQVYGVQKDGVLDDVFLVKSKELEDIHFVQFRIDIENDITQASLILQHKATEELYYFNFVIDKEVAEKIDEISILVDYEDFRPMYDLTYNVIKFEKDELVVAGKPTEDGVEVVALVNGEGENISKESEYMPDENLESPYVANYSTWYYFFRQLDNYGYTYLYEHAIDNDAITDNGWNNIHSGKYGASYSVSSHVRNNGSNEKIVEICLVEAVHQDTNTDMQSLQLYIDYTMELLYNTRTNKITVLYYNWGTYLYNIELVLEVPGGSKNETVFTSREIGGNLYQKPSTFRAAMGLVNYASTAFDIWDHLAYEESQSFGGIKTFEDTYDKQKSKYVNKVIRGIYCNSRTWEMGRAGDNIYLSGRLYDGYRRVSTWSYSYIANY